MSLLSLFQEKESWKLNDLIVQLRCSMTLLKRGLLYWIQEVCIDEE